MRHLTLTLMRHYRSRGFDNVVKRQLPSFAVGRVLKVDDRAARRPGRVLTPDTAERGLVLLSGKTFYTTYTGAWLVAKALGRS
jgi:hypothetical protein